MKKFYFTLLAIAAVFMTVDANAQITVGAGYNHGVMFERAADESETDGLDGFYLEATYDWDFMERHWGILAVQPGVRFSYVGDSDSDEMMGIKKRDSINETYLDIPINLKYSYPLGNLKISAFAGPVFSCGLTSVEKLSITGDNVDLSARVNKYTGKMSTKGDDSSLDIAPDAAALEYARFDVKLGVGIGASIADRLAMKLGYNIGLTNRYTGDLDYKVRTGFFYAGIGISF